MSDPQWRRVLELYETVVALPEASARAVLESCNEDPAIVQEVTVMLEPPHQTRPGLVSIPEELPEPEYAGCTIGRYDVIALIGRGSAGKVYSGRDRELARPVALKFMSTEYAGVGTAAQRFIREARAASALNHPNIVTVHEVVTWQSSPVIVMELIEGTPLRTLCAQRLPIPQVIRIAAQMMQALASVHAIGVVHRDLKPENIMVRPDGYIKLLDFGLARHSIVEAGGRNSSSSAGLPVGTLRYMSPEQCRGETATPASDVFAAGIVLYEILAGKHPFHADSPLDTAHAIAWSDPAPLTQVSPEIPPSIHKLLLRMLAKDPFARPAAADVAEALLVEMTRPESRRILAAIPRRSLRAGIALIAALAIVLLGVRLSQANRQSPRTSNLQIAPLASLRGAERHPCISADGTRVAFSFAGERATSHIYVKNLADERLTQLTSDALPDFQPVFSPDGAMLAFLRRADGRLRVMVVPSTGGIERQVGEIMDFLYEYMLLTWDADGQNLVISDRQDDVRYGIALFLLSIKTGERRQVTFPPDGASDWMPAVSSDGKTLVFARLFANGRGDLWSATLAGGPTRRLTHSKEVFFCWSWVNNGRDFLIGYWRSGRVYLWRQPADGGPQVRAAGLDDQVMAISVARTGRLVYAPGNDDDYNVWRYPIPPATDGPKPLLASAGFDGEARYSPDGKRIAFTSTRSGQSQIWTSDSEGSDLHQMTFPGKEDLTAISPNWSPDGRWIAHEASSRQTESNIFVLDLLGGKSRRLTGPGPSDIIPTWSRDSRWIYFCSDRGGGALQIWKAPVSGGQPVQVTQDGGLQAFESPDGKFLYYTKAGRQSGFWRMPIAGGKEVFVPGLESVSIRYWESSPLGIYFVAPSKSPVLKLFHFETGEVSSVMDLPVPPAKGHQGISVSADRRNLLYLQIDVATSNIMVVNNFH